MAGTSASVIERSTGERPAAAGRSVEDLLLGRMLAELSALFINLPAGEVDGAIEDGVARLSETLGLDGGGLLQLDEDGSRFRVPCIRIAAASCGSAPMPV